ncbi:MAG: hypothetical protein IKP09_10230 [Lentisphaeria bacterium]|nr:hypothetical protein [Lentisphaeria bacterium]
MEAVWYQLKRYHHILKKSNAFGKKGEKKGYLFLFLPDGFSADGQKDDLKRFEGGYLKT